MEEDERTMAFQATFLCDRRWVVQSFLGCSPTGLSQGMLLTDIVENACALLEDFGSRTHLELVFPSLGKTVPALIHTFPKGYLVMLMEDGEEGIAAAQRYEDAVEWAKDHLDGIFRSEYYQIQQLNNQLVDSKRALARSNSRLKQALDEVEQSNLELTAAQEAVKKALQVAERANRSKTAFLSGVSHDIRTPMNAIVGFISLMEHTDGLTKAQRGYLQKMRDSSQHLLELINDVLDISKIETGGMTLNEQPLSMTEQIGHVETLIRPQAQAKGQTFTVMSDKMCHDVFRGDEVRLQQVLMNLLSNAVKYTQNGGSIRLELTEDAGHRPDCAKICICVTDNGCGMSPEFAWHVFDAYSREARVSKIQGTGLGMAITKDIVSLMGGTIQVESEPDVGSRFTVTLELPILPEDELRAQSACDDGRGGSMLKGKRFLCAEDNALNREILEALLNMNGATCVIYPDGAKLVEAFQAVQPGDFDAILMDVQMPVMNGLEATRAIRQGKNPLGKAIPIIAMTANAFSADVQACLDAGMDAHVAKPFEIGALEKALRSTGKFLQTRTG